jgi:hypothetical protein
MAISLRNVDINVGAMLIKYVYELHAITFSKVEVKHQGKKDNYI